MLRTLSSLREAESLESIPLFEDLGAVYLVVTPGLHCELAFFLLGGGAVFR